MRSPCTVGEPWPRPGSGTFQTMPSDSLHRTGVSPPGAAIPSLVGPRQAGQSDAGFTAAHATLEASARKRAQHQQVPTVRCKRVGRETVNGNINIGFTASVCEGTSRLSSKEGLFRFLMPTKHTKI